HLFPRARLQRGGASFPCYFIFCFTAPAPAEFYPLSLHDALPIYAVAAVRACSLRHQLRGRHLLALRLLRLFAKVLPLRFARRGRSEEHTSELQSPYDLVCRLLLEKKKLTPWSLPILESILLFAAL